MANVAAYFGESIKSGSGMLAASDLSGTTSVANLYGPNGVGGYASAQFMGVVVNSSSEVVVAAGIGMGGVKVLGNKPQEGDPCQLCDYGEWKGVAAGAIAIGQLIMTDVYGRFTPFINENGNVACGEARTAATNANDIFTAFFFGTSGQVESGHSWPAADALTAHAGGTKAAALQLNYGFNAITVVASGGDSVLLPPALPGAICVIAHQAAANNIDAYGQGTDTIDAVGTATAYVVGHDVTVTFYGTNTGKWVSQAGTNVHA